MASTALDHITVQGFKSIASIDKLLLRPINIVIGPNGSGKSNFMGVFSFLHAIWEGRLRATLPRQAERRKCCTLVPKKNRVAFDIYFKGEANAFRLRLLPTGVPFEPVAISSPRLKISIPRRLTAPAKSWENPSALLRKPTLRQLAALEIGLDSIRGVLYFSNWLDHLESIVA